MGVTTRVASIAPADRPHNIVLRLDLAYVWNEQGGRTVKTFCFRNVNVPNLMMFFGIVKKSRLE